MKSPFVNWSCWFSYNTKYHFVDWSNHIYIVAFVNSSPRVYKVVLTTLGRSQPYLVKKHNPSSSSTGIYKWGWCLTCSFTHSLIQCTYLEGICRCSRKEKRSACSVLVYSWCFRLSLGIVLVIYYWGCFCWVFSPMRVSQDKFCVPCDCVSFSDPLYVVVLEMHWILM